MKQRSNPLIVISGTTASGKSSLALRLAVRFHGEIVSADSRQCYKYLDIGTSKPSLDERREIPHHLIDFLDLDKVYSAGRFLHDARRIMDEITGRGNVPFLVGGTGFYIKSALYGLPELPPVSESIVNNLKVELKTKGNSLLYAELLSRDPEYAKKIAPTDHFRLLHSLSVIRASNKPFSSFKTEDKINRQYLHINLDPPREILKESIAKRTRDMLRAGWVSEVKSLLDKGFDPLSIGFQTLGYKEIIDSLLGKISLDEAENRIVILTNQFAKRQQTFFRNQFENGIDLRLEKPDLDYLTTVLRGYLLMI